MRTTFEIRQHLEVAAAASGRSLAQEAEFRIERSFLDQRLMIEALELTYDRELAGILIVLGEVMKSAGQGAGFMATRTLEGSQNWWGNPYAFSQAIQAAVAVLDAMKPPGDPTPPPGMVGQAGGLDMGQVAETFGLATAQGLLVEIASEEPTTTTAIERAPRLRRALGRLVDRIKQSTKGHQS